MAIFESPDGGKTIYKRNVNENTRKLVGYKSKHGELFTFDDYLKIIELAETNTAIQKNLDNLLLLYYTIKDDSKSKT
jgi:hypothetical protein